MVLSTAYFPSISWVEAVFGGCMVEACENYQKQSIRNRAVIMTAGGVERLTVPVVHTGGVKVSVRDVRVDYAMPWQRVHSRAVMSAYRSSPYWDHFQGRVMPLFELRERFLFDLNERIVHELFDMLKISVPIVYTQQFEGAQEPPVTRSAEYYQVFSDRQPFARDLSVLDAIFCLASMPE